MLVSIRAILLVVCIVALVAGILLLVARGAEGPAALRITAAALAVGGGLGIPLLLLLPRGGRSGVESDEITELPAGRQRELMRGTSLFLREMHYRYSVRIDQRDDAARRSFAAEVNGVRLGFVPAIITDNTNDRQGYGYVAFVHDGARWRGPGLPCPDDQIKAVQHAARCVSPLATEEETHFEGEGTKGLRG